MTGRRAGWRRWGVLVGLGGPLVVFQQACLLSDPDIAFRAFLQTLTEIGIFVLDNLLVGIR